MFQPGRQERSPYVHLMEIYTRAESLNKEKQIKAFTFSTL